MYISTYEIKNHKVIRNRDILHKLVMLMFDKKRNIEKVLFMVESNKIVVQSENKPLNPPKDFKLLNIYNVTTMLDKFSNGTKLTLYGMFEPTICSNGKDNLIRNPNDRINWVCRKLSESCNVLSIKEISKDDVCIKKNGCDKRRTSFFSYVISVNIKDTQLFKNAFQNGLGRSKAYGAGLISILNEF